MEHICKLRLEALGSCQITLSLYSRHGNGSDKERDWVNIPSINKSVFMWNVL